MKIITMLLSSLAPAVLCLGAIPPQGVWCELTCSADAFYVIGSQPTGGLTILVGNEEDGTGSIYCSTCTRCKADVSISFYAPPGSNNCLSYTDDQSPTGWSEPDNNYSRSGTMRANCDSQDVLQREVSIHDCGGSPSSQGSHRVYLFCPCS